MACPREHVPEKVKDGSNGLEERVNATEEETKRGEEPEPEFLWRQYSLWLDVYKFHMDSLLKANTFY